MPFSWHKFDQTYTQLQDRLNKKDLKKEVLNFVIDTKKHLQLSL